ncbi:MAG: hypothetical protein RLZZ519_3407 [Bacteroidota bacterium]|jgi:undecaprenyl-diphosphatase
MDWLQAQDVHLLVAINRLHSPFGDVVMVIVSNKWVWIPLYCWLVYLLFRYQPRNSFWLTMALVIPVILIADQFTSGLLKPLIARPRPCHVPVLRSLLHLADGCGGKFGFASSHAANFFAIATYIGWHLKHEIRSVPYLLFGIAGLVAFSRIYLGAHYPGDVLGGIFVGIAAGYTGIGLFKFLSNRWAFPQKTHKTRYGKT